MIKSKKIIFVSKGKEYSPMKEKLVQDLKDLFLIIENAHRSYEIWWMLISKDGRDKYFKSMLHCKEFFEPTAFAHTTTIVINLYKLFEIRKDTLNFKRLIKIAEELKIFDPKQIVSEFKEAKALWIKIAILRSKLFAHKNYPLTPQAIYREAHITPDQIKRLIDLSLMMFNALWLSLGRKVKKIENFSTRDTEKVLEKLLTI